MVFYLNPTEIIQRHRYLITFFFGTFISFQIICQMIRNGAQNYNRYMEKQLGLGQKYRAGRQCPEIRGAKCMKKNKIVL